MACATNCKLVRTKNKNRTTTHYDASGITFDLESLPINPILPPSNPHLGDILIEYYDNAIAFWKYESGWGLSFYYTTADRHTTFYDVGSASINFSSLPGAPTVVLPAPFLGDTLHEKYSNGQIFWTFNGSIWIRNYVLPNGRTTYLDQTAHVLNETALPSTPISSPTNPAVNDTLIEHYANADIFWTYNGINWIRTFYSTKCCTVLNDEEGNSFNPSNITTPITATIGVAGNVLIESYDNATVFWKHNGVTWVYQFHRLDGVSNKNTHIDATGGTLNPSTIPADPSSLPNSPILNDTIIEHYENGTLFWTYNGTDWVLDFADFHCVNMYNTASGEYFNPTSPPVTPNVLPANVVSCSTLVEKYENATVFWSYNGTDWIYAFHIMDGIGNRTIHSDETDISIDYANLPTQPATLPVEAIAGDTLLEHYENGDIYWIYNGITWLLDWVKSDCCTLINDESTETLDFDSLPTSPLNPPASSAPGNIIIEKYSNAIVFWVFDGSNWYYRFHQSAGTSNRNTHSNLVGQVINYDAIPTEPFDEPTSSITNDTLVEHYDNGNIYWTYDGTNWTLDWVDNDCCTTLSVQNVTFNTVPSAPVAPPLGATPGQILIEHYNNGEVFWEYDGSNWQFVFVSSKAIDTYTTHYDASGSSLDSNNLPSAPISPPNGVNPSHTLHEKYDNGQVFWTYDGTNWNLDYVISNVVGLYEYPAIALYNCNNPPTEPENSSVVASINDRITEHYSNNTRFVAATIIWEYDGIDWNTITTIYYPKHFVHEVEDEIVPLNIANNTGYLSPVSSGTFEDYVEGDTLHENYNNGFILWEYIGCQWLRRSITLNSSCDICENIDITPIITANRQEICSGESVTFVENSIFTSTLDTSCIWQGTVWSFGDGTPTVSGRNVSHTFATEGLYAVTASVTCTGGLTAVHTVYIKVSDIVAEFSVNRTNPSVNQEVVFKQLSNVNGCYPTYTWDFGDGSTFVGIQPPPHAYSAPGSYTATLTVSCEIGCTDTSSVTITVSTSSVIADFAISDDTIALGQSVTLTDTSVASDCVITSWVWEYSTNVGITWTQFSTLQNPTFTPPAAGVYSVRLTASCANSSDYVILNIIVSNIIPNFTLDFDTVVTGQTVIVESTSTSVQCTIISLSWSVSINGAVAAPFGTGLSSEDYTPSVSGDHYIILTVTCGDGTVRSISKLLQVNPDGFVIADILLDSNTICVNSGQSVQFIDNSQENGCSVDTWLWEIDDGAGGTFTTYSTLHVPPAFTPTSGGNYRVRLTVTCSTTGATDMAQVIVNANKINANFAGVFTNVNVGDTLTFTDTSTVEGDCGINSWTWRVSTNGGTSYTTFSTIYNPSYTFTNAGTYYLRLIAGCDSCTNFVQKGPINAGSVSLTGLCYRDISTNVITWNFGTMIPNNAARTQVNGAGRTVTVDDGNGGTVDVTMKNINGGTGSGGYGHSGTSDSPRLTLGINSLETVSFTFTFSKSLNLVVAFEALRDGEEMNVSSDGIITYHHTTEAGSGAVITGNGTNNMNFDASATAGGAGGNPGIAGSLTIIDATTITFFYTSDDTSGNDNVKLLFKILNNNIIYYNDSDSDGLNVIRLSDGVNVGAVNTAWELINCSVI